VLGSPWSAQVDDDRHARVRGHAQRYWRTKVTRAPVCRSTFHASQEGAPPRGRGRTPKDFVVGSNR